MQSFHEYITATDTEYLFFAGWQLDLGQRLLSGATTSQVETVFTSFHSRSGIDLRVMLSDHVRNGNKKAHKQFNELGIQCIRDARHPLYGSAHQKFGSFCRNGRLHAFCGGIDLAADRWDDADHSSSLHRQYVKFPGGWHDVHCLVQGPACRDIDVNFRERWNENRKPRSIEDIPPKIISPIPPTPVAGNHHVQVLRTFACDQYQFAPRGDFTGRKAILKAISLAQDYIYIEDQYFVAYEVAAALEAALQRSAQLRIIVVVPLAPDSLARNFNFHQHVLIERLKNGPNGARFAIYHLVNTTTTIHAGEQVYVHAKSIIIDDVWAEIGSINMNRRSMTHNSELVVAVVDSTLIDGVCLFARELRLTLWAEHLGLNETDPLLVNPISGFDRWTELAGTPGVPIVSHQAGEKQRDPWNWNHVHDPQQLCSDEPRIPPVGEEAPDVLDGEAV